MKITEYSSCTLMDFSPTHPQLAESTSAAFWASKIFFQSFPVHEVMRTIRRGIEGRKGLLVLSGEAGVDKTSLLQAVSAELPTSTLLIPLPDPPES
jgi:hypothetical protein